MSPAAIGKLNGSRSTPPDAPVMRPRSADKPIQVLSFPLWNKRKELTQALHRSNRN